jgi:quinol monooxygenase YgiN
MRLHSITVSTPYPRFPVGDADPGTRVLVVLTQGRIDPDRRSEFDRQTTHVLDAMAAQPGLLGYSAKRELFGDTVWTLTMWENDGARRQFLASAVHRRAVDLGGAAVVAMLSWRAELGVEEVPRSWPEALAMWADADATPNR